MNEFFEFDYKLARNYRYSLKTLKNNPIFVGN